jgi:hypothetical protein
MRLTNYEMSLQNAQTNNWGVLIDIWDSHCYNNLSNDRNTN